MKVPQGPTRPTSDRVREAIFSQLDHRMVLSGARVLDLFAGSGALGLEALSRGATHATFVDHEPRAIRTISSNIEAILPALTPRPTTTVLRQSAGSHVDDARGEPYDLVLIDPPYDNSSDSVSSLLRSLIPHLASRALVVLERSTRSEPVSWPEGLTLLSEKTYGDTRVELAEFDR